MCTYYLKSYSQKEEIRKPHFFILNKGNNSGKPLLTPCPNCFTIQFESTEDKEQVYWLLFCLWQSNAFYQYLRGSVIPFIILRDVKSCLNENLNRADRSPEQFQKMVTAFQKMNQLENLYRQNLKTIEKTKQLIVYRFIV
jgi:hypothetical protein